MILYEWSGGSDGGRSNLVTNGILTMPENPCFETA
jgi:hypothetical protein